MLAGSLLFGVHSYRPADALEIAQPQKMPSYTASGQNVYVVWYDNISENGGLLFSKSVDGGISFTNPMKILDGTAVSMPIRLGASGNNVYLVWSDPNWPYDIFFLRSSDAGETFEGPTNLSNDPAFSNFPQLAISGNNVYVIWLSSDGTFGNDILLRASLDNGKSFGQSTTLTSFGSHQLKITAHEDSVYAAWVELSNEQHDIIFATSSDNGKKFNKSTIGDPNMHDYGPDIFATRNAVYLAYFEWIGEEADYPSASKVILQKSTDNGKTFDQPLKVSGNDSGLFSEVPQIIAAHSSAETGDNVYLVWRDAVSNKTEVSLRISNDSGATFGNIITPSNMTSAYPTSAISVIEAKNILLVAWSNSVEYGKWDIFLASSNKQGDVLNVSKVSDSGHTSDPQLVASGNSTAYLFWTDGKYDQEHNDIFFSRITSENDKNSQIGPIVRISTQQVEYGTPQAQDTALLQRCQKLGISEQDCGEQAILQKESEPKIQQPEDWSGIYKGSLGWMPLIFGVGAVVAGIIAFITLRKRKD